MPRKRQTPGVALLPQTWNPETDTLERAMRILGLNRVSLGNLLGRHRNTVANYIKGKTKTPRSVVLMLQQRIKLRNLAENH